MLALQCIAPDPACPIALERRNVTPGGRGRRRLYQSRARGEDGVDVRSGHEYTAAVRNGYASKHGTRCASTDDAYLSVVSI